MGQDQRHYNINKLNIIFAVSALVLLGAVGMLFMNDYDRSWKDFQKEFRTLEIEKTRVKFDKESINLSENSEYQSLLEETEQARKSFSEKCSKFHDVEEELNTLKAKNDLISQNYKFKKAELDAAKYKYEHEQAQNGPELDSAKETYFSLTHLVDQLKIDLEQSTTEVTQKQKIIKDCGLDLKELQRKENQAALKKNLLERKLGKIDPANMSFINQIANMVRDLPVIDLANPNYKIQQLVLKDVHDNVNFMTVPKVERCTTCHLGISDPDYVDAAQPFRTHPNLELYVGKNSPHALEEFGCTVCHGGRARGTSFSSTAHTPSSEEQAEEWAEKYDWKEIHLWEDPMLPEQYFEAGCFKCHSGQSTIKGADKLNLGIQLIEKAGCYNCHVIDKYKEWPKSGPDLRHLAAKLPKDWAYKWIQDPKSFRHNTWMPNYFNQDNNNDPESLARSAQEIHAMVEYLFKNSEEYTLNKVSFRGADAKKGEELVKSIGCMACHQIENDPLEKDTTIDDLRQQHGFNLIGLGTKTSKEWLYDWLKDPQRYHPEARMPNLRLTDDEAKDIAEYLSQNRNTKFENKDIPPVDTNQLGIIVYDFLVKQYSVAQTKEKIASMSTEEKLVFAGEKLIGQYGCFSCHNIKGFENVKPIGTELTEEGSKNIHKLDFGFVEIEHSKEAWFKQKIMAPRIYDTGKEKAALDKLIMPNFNMNEQEAEAVTTAILGFVNQSTVRAKQVPRTPENLIKEKGQEIVKQFNCQACHNIEKDGGIIQKEVEKWLIEYQGMTDAEASKVYPSYSPPDLFGIGAKANPEWLFNFIHNPTDKLRPWLSVRMPTYNFNAAHLNALVKYFNTLDQTNFPFNFEADTTLTAKEYEAAEKLFSAEYFNCTQCHVVGDQYPSGTKDSWAPDLTKTKYKINPHWLIEWIRNPQNLVPGTKMPTFFDPDDYENSGPPDILNGDENEQIRVLRNFLMTLTNQTTQKKRSTPAEPAAAVDNSEKPVTDDMAAQ